MTAKAILFATCIFGSLHAQTAPPAPAPATPPLAFSVVSIKPAPPGAFVIAPQFMRDKGVRILGVQTISAPVNMLVGYGYQMQMSEALDTFRKQPDWTKKKIYTVAFRADGEPTRPQLREMMRTMLADRFGLEVHEFTREGTVSKFVLNKPGVPGPNLKPHPPGAGCTTQDSSSWGKTPDASEPAVAHCGFYWYYLPGNILHVEMTDTSIAAVGTSLASVGDNGLGLHPVIDATGLTGKYDLKLEFRPSSLTPLNEAEADDGGAPSLLQALKDQLGLRVESGQGPVRMVVIDHIAPATPD